MAKKICLLMTFLTLSVNAVKAQGDNYKRIRIGETVPELTLPTVINYNKSSVKLSDFRGKLLILDFWSIYCGGCIEAMPRFEQLQNKFKDRLMILPVSFTKPKKDVEAFFLKRKNNGMEIRLPSAVYNEKNDPLSTMFPFYGFPLEIWIDEGGKVLAITDGFYVTEENILKALSHTELNFPISGSYVKEKPASLPIKPKDAVKPDIGFYSRVTSYSDTLLKSKWISFHLRRENGTKLWSYNTPIVNLFKASFWGVGKEAPFYNNYVSVEIPDSAWIFMPKFDNDFQRNAVKNLFCYELLLPENTSDEDALALMNQELGVYFGIKSSIEKRATPVYVLKQLSNSFMLNTKIKEQYTSLDKAIGRLTLKNAPTKLLVLSLSSYAGIVLDETGYTNIDIEINIPKDATVKQLNTVLKDYDLLLEPATRDVEKIILKKKSPN